jgi:hypothetical protein
VPGTTLTDGCSMSTPPRFVQPVAPSIRTYSAPLRPVTATIWPAGTVTSAALGVDISGVAISGVATSGVVISVVVISVVATSTASSLMTAALRTFTCDPPS